MLGVELWMLGGRGVRGCGVMHEAIWVLYGVMDDMGAGCKGDV